MTRAPVNRIIDHSSVDGPGNRTVFFFQGCNFNCGYCHNPETINMCINCGECVPACPSGALTIKENVVRFDPRKCRACDTCIKICKHNASPRVVFMTPEEGKKKLEQNRPFIRGVTVSGGECSLYRDFVFELFQYAKAMNLNTLMDSNGSYDFSKDPALMEVCDGVMLDVKCADDAAHRALTGRSNVQVMQNLDFLASKRKLEEVRTVVVPGALPSEETVRAVAAHLKPHWTAGMDIAYKLIRYRPMGVRAFYRDHATPNDALMESLKEIVVEAGCPRVIVI